MTPLAPFPGLRWLLRHLSSRHAADATIGDILEELDARRAAGHAPRSPRGWLNLRMVASLGAAAAAAMPTAVRSLGLTMRNAIRSLRRAPVPSLFIFLILAVAISAATVTFSVVDAVVLRPLPFDHSERIVTIFGQNFAGPRGINAPQFEAIRSRVTGFDSVGYFTAGRAMEVTIDGSTESLGVAQATSDTFRVLRLVPLAGRLWSPDEEAHRADDVALISARLWRTHFDGDAKVVGRLVGIGSRRLEIIGVLPDAVTSIGDDRFTQDIWRPATRQMAFWASRPVATFSALARLTPGVSIEDVTREISAAVAAIPPADPVANKNWRPVVGRWDQLLIGDARGWLLLLLAAVAMVLAIACVNVANVLLTQSADRARDLAVRASLGASRRQLAASVLMESLLLSISAGAVALLFCTWGIHAAKASVPQTIRLFRENAIALNGRVLGAGALAALVTGVVFGFVPAWQASRTSVVALLKDAGAGATGRGGWRSAFLVAEVSSIGVLLVVSTLFVTSFVRVMTFDLGFDRAHLVAVPSISPYKGAIADIQNQLAHVPGVNGVVAVGAQSLPLLGSSFGSGVWFDTPLQPVGDQNDAHDVDVEIYRVSSNFFDVAGMKFVRGSSWRPNAVPTPRPIVIDEVAARQLFGTGDPIGQLVHAHDMKDAEFTIVGIVPFAYSRGPDQSRRPSAYYALAPDDAPTAAGFLVRTTGAPGAFVRSIASVMASVSTPTSGRADVRAIDDVFRQMTTTRRFNAALMLVLAVFGLLIAATGIYAVMTSIVAQQTKEIGVRVALGATSSDIRQGVLARAGRHVLAGLALGLPAGWLISHGFESQFFQVKTSDVSIYLIVAATLAVVALAAAIVPARRAARVDPVVSLRAS